MDKPNANTAEVRPLGVSVPIEIGMPSTERSKIFKMRPRVINGHVPRVPLTSAERARKCHAKKRSEKISTQMNEFINNVCRGCLCKTKDTLNSLLHKPLMIDLFKRCTNITIEMNDGLSIYLCTTCINKCIAWNSFKMLCAKTNSILKSKLKFVKTTAGSVKTDRPLKIVPLKTPQPKTIIQHELVTSKKHTTTIAQLVKGNDLRFLDKINIENKNMYEVTTNKMKQQLNKTYNLNSKMQNSPSDKKFRMERLVPNNPKSLLKSSKPNATTPAITQPSISNTTEFEIPTEMRMDNDNEEFRPPNEKNSNETDFGELIAKAQSNLLGTNQMMTSIKTEKIDLCEEINLENEKNNSFDENIQEIVKTELQHSSETDINKLLEIFTAQTANESILTNPQQNGQITESIINSQYDGFGLIGHVKIEDELMIDDFYMSNETNLDTSLNTSSSNKNIDKTLVVDNLQPIPKPTLSCSEENSKISTITEPIINNTHEEFGLFVDLEIKEEITVDDFYIPDQTADCDNILNSQTNASFQLEELLNEHDIMKYKCLECGKHYKHKKSLNDHQSVHRITLLECQECGDQFNSELKRKQHLSKCYKILKPFNCILCDKLFASEWELLFHTQFHINDKLFKYPSVSTPTNNNILNEDKKIYTDDLAHRCRICGRTFVNKSMFDAHVKNHSIVKPHKCLLCDKSFKKNNALIIHIRRHTGEKPFKCKVCDKGFASVGDLNIHARYHSVKQFECNECGKSFANKNDLIKHLRIHMDVKPFKCPMCEKGFPWRAPLTKHMKSHMNYCPYICTFCDKTFIETTSLATHMQVHLNDINIQCSHCSKSFLNKKELIIHIREHSHDSYNSNASPFECSASDNKSGEKPFKCTICYRTFQCKSHLNAHLKNYFFDKLVTCKLCKKTFWSKSKFTTHLTSHDSK